jgi:integrase/recombinase XerC
MLSCSVNQVVRQYARSRTHWQRRPHQQPGESPQGGLLGNQISFDRAFVRKGDIRLGTGIVLEAMDAEEKPTFSRRQAYARDRFLFIALRQLGLRTSELVKATMSAFYRLSDPQDGKTYWVMVVREETAKGQKERKIPVPRLVLEALAIYREAFGMASLPDAAESLALLLSTRTNRAAMLSGGSAIKDIQSRRYFQAWLPVTTRHGLYYIVKKRLGEAAAFLESVGDIERSIILRQVSPHWLRHTFAKAALLSGQDIRHVASVLGHSDLSTTMVYTEQDALDLIRSTNRIVPGLLAIDTPSFV